MNGVETYVGHERARALLVQALDDAEAHGRGSAWLISGPAGIGKSRLSDLVSEVARGRGVNVHWGRCREAGAAPAYWPWRQILKGVCRSYAAGGRDRQVLEDFLLSRSPAYANDGEEAVYARAGMHASLASALERAATRGPMVLVLEDIHVGDSASLALLAMVTDATRHSPLVVCATVRGREVASELEPLVVDYQRRARTIRLGPLDRAESRALLESIVGPISDELSDRVYERSEGLPLFLIEFAKLVRSWGPHAISATSLPPGIVEAVHARVGVLPQPAQRAVTLASVLGREVGLDLAHAVLEDLCDDLSEAVDAGLLIEGPEGYRFSHALVRDAIYDQMPVVERRAAHAKAAMALEQLRPCDWPEVAHHYEAAGEGWREQALAALLNAGREAQSALAPTVALQHFYKAQALLTPAVPTDVRLDAALGLAEAEILNGRYEAGTGRCFQAADEAEAAGRSRHLVRAALTAGSALVPAMVNRPLVGLLRRAMAAVGDERSGMRARVQARLAAALQPAPDPEPPMRLAREAIALARELGDPGVLLEVLRTGGAALSDLGPVSERVAVNLELDGLAHVHGAPLSRMRAKSRLVFDLYEAGDLSGALRTTEQLLALTDETPHEGWRLRGQALRGALALWRGELAVAAEVASHLREFTENWSELQPVATWLELRVAAARADYPRVRELGGDLARYCAGSAVLPVLVRAAVGSVLRRSGRSVPSLAVGDLSRLLRFGDHLSLGGAACAVTSEPGELPRALAERLERMAGCYVSTGQMLMTWDEPFDLYRARLLRREGRARDALDLLESTARHLEEHGGVLPWLDTVCELAEAGRDVDGQGLRALESRARETARKLGLNAALRRLESVGSTERKEVGPSLSMARQGPLWQLSLRGRSIQVTHCRGLEFIERLVTEPEREIHSLDLVSPGRSASSSTPLPSLDEEALDAYRRRRDQLRTRAKGGDLTDDLARELAFIERELSRGTRLDGGARATGDAERARTNVQRRIKHAIRLISKLDQGFGEHLDRSLTTGTYCVYRPRGT